MGFVETAADDVLFRRHKINAARYYQMAETGVLGPADRVELIEGELIEMAPIGDDHAATVDELNEVLVLACQERAIVAVQNPIRADSMSVPEPDFAICRLRADRYRGGRPGPEDIFAVIEVSDSSLRFDRTVKLKLYARTGVPEYWIVDLKRRVVEVFRQPDAEGYRALQTFGPQDTVALAMVPDIRISLARVFG